MSTMYTSIHCRRQASRKNRTACRKCLGLKPTTLQYKVSRDSIGNMFKGIWSDLVYAARSLVKARAFTFVCIVSLGIGMAPVIAVPYVTRIPQLPPPGVNTEGLVEVITKAAG